MLYTIKNKKDRDWNGKKFVEAELVAPDGELFKVSAWAGEFDGKDEWEGELTKNDKGYWKLVTKKAVAGANFKTQQMEKVIERKEQSITKFQDNKEIGIKISSTMRDAVQLGIIEYTQNKASFDNLDECVLKWREWLWKHWDDHEDYPPFYEK